MRPFPRPLRKTVIVIWSDPETIGNTGIACLAQEAENGLAYCSASSDVIVQDPEQDPNWDGTEFFGVAYGEVPGEDYEDFLARNQPDGNERG